ncbi:hypothetical protein [Sinorhizobium prairiense]|uniref:hypothetical protein n=1 Tax=unclassified Sinorhizobium TaxID=2613772 RepID=UPI0023D89986|nr:MULTISPECIES: hypothetical protein [unclassified Sinorhizobium]WEJ11160.1 hypothetical protein N0Q90_08685 [Sinorhizobium sp. M103]WEJ14240.1 hypothetical protein N0Q91_11635 [Sinorhizobium sp. K101]WEJ38145.1 hypothetical protein N0R80_08660 [Sinorhizobium sp. C101]
MAETNSIVFSIIEDEIRFLSRVPPGQISHLGIRAKVDGQVREWNFGLFRNGKYEPVGVIGDPRMFSGK